MREITPGDVNGKTVTQTVDCSDFRDFASYNTVSLNALISYLSEVREAIPHEWRDTAECELTSDYESSSVELEVTFTRPATDEEIRQAKAAAKAEMQARAMQQRQKELHLLAELKRRYES